MKRLHVSLAVSDLAQSVRFYATLFGREPTVLKPDYAKWMLDDPRVNFAIQTHGARPGLDHLGIQVDDDAELADVAQRLQQAGESVHRQAAATCCYAQSNKAWVHDPQDIAWETFHTFDTSESYGEDGETRAPQPMVAESTGCCAPSTTTEGGGHGGEHPERALSLHR